MGIKCVYCGVEDQLCFNPKESDPESFVCAMCSGETDICYHCDAYCTIGEEQMDCCVPPPIESRDSIREQSIQEAMDLDDPGDEMDLCILLDFVRVARVRANVMSAKNYRNWMKQSIDVLSAYLERDFNRGGIHELETQ